MPRSKVLVVDDERLVRWSLEQKLAREGYDVESAPTGEEGLNLLREGNHELVLLDLRLPGMDGVQTLQEIKKLEREIAVVILTADTGISRAVECVRLGAHNYLCKPFDFDEVRLALDKAREDLKLRCEVSRLHRRQQRESGVENLVGPSAAMRATRELIGKIAASDATTVLVEGENGTGKELAARAVHFGSARAEQPFLDVNCTAVPETLFESELFGHERGAFTDAKTMKKGLFELADGGTLLLDEIGDLKPAMQVKLLRVLETRKFRRVGGTQDIAVDVRVVALSNKDLVAAVRAGEFRQDLYYRLKVIAVKMPPLRDRAEDIVPLAEHFLEHFAEEFKKSRKQLAPEAQQAFCRYSWPGNVRELRNAIERLVILEADPVVALDHLPLEIRAGVPSTGPSVMMLPTEGIALETVERDLVRQAMERTAGNQTRAAELLGIERDALRRRLIKFGFREGSSSDAA
jgi:DNA-binding NtrC family response regulator